MFVLAFIYRIKFVDQVGTGVIGVGRKAMTPILVIDIVVNIWLTALFVQPLLANSQSKTSRSSLILRKVALRTLIGFVLALVTCLGNIISLYITQGEKGWICLMVCNLESKFPIYILYLFFIFPPHTTIKKCSPRSRENHVLILKYVVLVAALILQWVTAMDKAVPKDIQLQQSAGATFNSTTLSTLDDSSYAKSNTMIQSRTLRNSMQFDALSAPDFITSAAAEDNSCGTQP